MTGGDIPVGDFTYSATADYSSYQFSAVTFVAAGTVTLSTANQAAIGILQDKPAAAGATCAVREIGHSKARMLSSGTKGDALKVADGYGRLGTASVGTDIVVAIALESWAATDTIIEVALTVRTAQGAAYRSGHLVFNIPMVNLGTSGASNALAALPLGFAGTINNIVAIPTAVASSSGATTITAKIGTTVITTLSCALSNAALKTLGTPVTGVAATAANTFVSTDTLTIVTTPTVTFATDTGMLEIHVIYT
jgi:hypothetical protein